MKPIAVLLVAAGIAACAGKPTQKELDERERELIDYCNDLRDDIEDKSDRPILRATAQERYNRECLGVTYPTPSDN